MMPDLSARGMLRADRPERAREAPAQPRLFLVVLGGRIARGNIELHDVRFVAGVSIEDTFPQLRAEWFGDRRGLHLDSWMVVRFVDGWRVELRLEPSETSDRLWFVNLGGYDPAELAESHRFGLVVAPSPQAARWRAQRRWRPGSTGQHKDDLHAVEDCLASQPLAEFHVHLLPDPEARSQPMAPDWFGYRRIDRG